MVPQRLFNLCFLLLVPYFLLCLFGLLTHFLNRAGAGPGPHKGLPEYSKNKIFSFAISEVCFLIVNLSWKEFKLKIFWYTAVDELDGCIAGALFCAGVRDG